MIYQGVEQLRVPNGNERYENIERALLSALPENIDARFFDKLLRAFKESLKSYDELGIHVELSTDTELQANTGLELLFTQSFPDGNHVTPIRMQGVLAPALTKKGKPIIKLLDHAQVIGWTLPRPDETFIDSYKRADDLLQAVLLHVDPTLMGNRQGFDLQPTIAVLNLQQLGQWLTSRESPVLPPESYREGAPKLRDVVQNIRDALKRVGQDEKIELRILTLSNLDVEIMLVDKETGQVAPVDILGLRLLNSGSKSKTEWVKNNIGVKLFEEGSETYRIESVRARAHHFRTISPLELTHIPNYRVVSVNGQLLDYWEYQYMGGAVPIREVEEEVDTGAHTKGYEGVQSYEVAGSQLVHGSYIAYEFSKSGIGARPTFLQYEFQDGTTEQVCLDFGSQREHGYFYNSLFDPSIKLGLEPFRQVVPSTDELPMFYRLTLKLNSAATAGSAFLQDSPPNSDLIDLYLSLSKADFRRLLGKLDSELSESETEGIIDEIEQIVQDDKKKYSVKYIALLISHCHDDHTGFVPIVGSHIPEVSTPDSRIFGDAGFNRGSWLKEIFDKRPKGTILHEKGDRNYSPQQIVLRPYETRFLGRGKVSVTSLPCDHSIYGSTMFLIVAYDDFGVPIHKTLYTGDYRFKDNGLTEKTVEVLEALGGADTVITEATNIKSDTNKRISTALSKEKLHDNYDHLFEANVGTPIIVQVDAKDLELIELISHHAELHSRQIIYSMPHSGIIELARQYRAAEAFEPLDISHQQKTVELLNSSLSADHWLRNEVLRTTPFHPIPDLIGKKILTPIKDTLNKLERRIEMYYPDQLIDRQKLPSVPDALIFIRPTNPIEEEMANIAPYLGGNSRQARQSATKYFAILLRAHYFTYQEREKDLARRDRDFCHKMNWLYLSDLRFEGRAILPSPEPELRMSGHAQEEDILNFMEQMAEINPDTEYIFVHTEKRRIVSEKVQSRVKNVKIYKQMTKGKWVHPMF